MTTATRKKCASCRRKAVYIIHNGFHREANGKAACGSAACWGALTLGYPAEGRLINPTAPKEG